MVTSLIFPVFFESVGYVIRSTILTIIRTVICFVPIGFILARLFGLYWFWLVYPITEIITTIVGYIFYFQFLKKHNELMDSE
jgi:Na+-driven multidrug efflux pump